jgi:hypothetical protein
MKSGHYYVDYGMGWTIDHYDGERWAAMEELMSGDSIGIRPLRTGPRIPMPDEDLSAIAGKMAALLERGMLPMNCPDMFEDEVNEVLAEYYASALAPATTNG